MGIHGYQQFDQKPDWIVDRHDDYHPDHHEDPEAIGFKALVLNHDREKVAQQMVDAATVFIGLKNPFPVAGNFKKTANIGGELPAVVEGMAGHGGGGRKIPGMGAVAAVFDDAAMIARNQIGSLFHKKKDQQPPTKIAGVLGTGAKSALRSAAEWGAAGSVTGALTAPKGHRMRGAMVGGLAGGAGGAVAPGAGNVAGNVLSKIGSPYDETPMMDMYQRAADMFPEKANTFDSVKSDAKQIIDLLGDKVHGLRKARLEFANPKTAFDLKSFAGHVIPKQVMTGEGLGVALGGAGIGGLSAYLSSRPKEELGGQSRAETDLKKLKASLPENPEGIGGAVKKHVVNMHSDVAEQMRKHPVAATVAGAGAGSLIATRLAALAGLGSHLK